MEGLNLLVEGLNLLVEGLNLLVEGLNLLVEGLNLLVEGLNLQVHLHTAAFVIASSLFYATHVKIIARCISVRKIVSACS